jgi:hypothetical protein
VSWPSLGPHPGTMSHDWERVNCGSGSGLLLSPSLRPLGEKARPGWHCSSSNRLWVMPGVSDSLGHVCRGHRRRHANKKTLLSFKISMTCKSIKSRGPDCPSFEASRNKIETITTRHRNTEAISTNKGRLPNMTSNPTTTSDTDKLVFLTCTPSKITGVVP